MADVRWTMTTEATPPKIYLHPGRDRRVQAGHPWAYSNEVRMTPEVKALAPGTVATLHRVDGKPLGVGTVNPHALIAFRIFDRDADTVVDEGFLGARLKRALALRERFFDQPFYRLVHAESDGLPGFVIDRFGDIVAVQANTAGAERLLESLIAAVHGAFAPSAVVLRNDGRARAFEGLDSHVRVAEGLVDGPIDVREGGLVFHADVVGGQKTGWYFDQRDNRAFVATLIDGGRLLDAYCHTGGFAIAAAAARARDVVGLDSSEAALALAAESAALNGVGARAAFRRADVFDVLGQLAAGGERFDVVADPPAFVRSKKELSSGIKGYRKLARLAAPLVEPGGFLFIASCFHNVETAAFAAEVAIGLGRAGRSGRIVRAAGAGPDHPVHPHLPETAYLKTLTLQLD